MRQKTTRSLQGEGNPAEAANEAAFGIAYGDDSAFATISIKDGILKYKEANLTVTVANSLVFKIRQDQVYGGNNGDVILSLAVPYTGPS